MMNRIDLRGSTQDPRDLLPRAQLDVSVAVEKIRPVVEAVREHGFGAIQEFSEKFDGVRPERLRVPAADLAAAAETLDPEVRAALLEAIKRARKVHADQRRTDVTTRVVAGGTVTERWVPVARVGLYVPGGLAVYPSTVVMNVVPAQEAGVGSLVVASPPQQDNGGLPDARVLAACALLGIEEVYGVGGAQAIAMLGYGSDGADEGDRCEPVDVITGPGNIWVTAAKRMLRGSVGIDTETVRQIAATKHAARVQTALSGEQSGIVLVDDLEQGLRVVDAYAAEHLEIQTRDAREWAMRVRNAGAIFVGAWSPVSLGDYAAGSNHVLPTGGCARHSSGLSVQSFLRGIHVVEYDRNALHDVAGHVDALAGAEDLPAHAAAVTARF